MLIPQILGTTHSPPQAHTYFPSINSFMPFCFLHFITGHCISYKKIVVNSNPKILSSTQWSYFFDICRICSDRGFNLELSARKVIFQATRKAILFPPFIHRESISNPEIFVKDTHSHNLFEI